MKERTTAKRYGKALFDLVLSFAPNAGEGDCLAKDILRIKTAAEKVSSMVRALSDARIDVNRRIACADAIARELNVCTVAANFLKLLIKNSRVELLGLIMDDFVMRMERREKLATCRATVADASFSSEVQKKIEEIVGQSLKTKARCDVRVSPPLIGGFLLSIGDKKYDASIKGRIERLKEELFKTA